MDSWSLISTRHTKWIKLEGTEFMVGEREMGKRKYSVFLQEAYTQAIFGTKVVTMNQATLLRYSCSLSSSPRESSPSVQDCFFLTDLHSIAADPMIVKMVRAMGIYNVCTTDLS